MSRTSSAWTALAATIPLLAFGPVSPRPASNHWAVIVGVSDYVNFEGVKGGDLPGAEHDAAAMRDVLVARWGFPTENIHMLLNKDATRAAIEQQLTGWLKTNVKSGDPLKFVDSTPYPDRIKRYEKDSGLPEAVICGTGKINGIAYDRAHKRLLVTGKLWPTVFEIRLAPEPRK